MKKKMVLVVLSMALFAIGFSQNKRVITGRVLDAVTRAPLAGATVNAAENGGLQTTDQKGYFSIHADKKFALLVSYVGYKVFKGEFTAADTAVIILMVTEASALDEVVVIGYGVKEKRKDLTSSISSISGREVSELPVTNIASAIASRVPGLEVHSNGYAPGQEGQTINVRGLNSIYSNGTPLYVVDGTIIQGDISNLNTADIASIEVLKDASAAGIYGSRAANGVILISTKHGSGAPSIDFSAYAGVQTPNPAYKMLGAKEYANLRRWAWYNADPLTYPLNTGKADSAIFNPLELQTIKNGYNGYDWQKAVTNPRALEQSYSLSVGSGNAQNRIYLSGNYLNQDGILKNTNFKKYGAHFSIESTLSERLKAGGTINFSEALQKGVDATVYQQSLTQSPLQPIYDSTGHLLINTDRSSGTLTIYNPVANDINTINNYTQDRGFGNVFLEFSPVKNLMLRSSLGGDLKEEEYDKYSGSNSTSGFSSNGTGEIYKVRTTDLLWENTLTYFYTKGNHNFNSLIGYTSEKTNQSTADIQGSHFPTDLLNFKDIQAAEQIVASSNYIPTKKNESFIGRVIYKYKGRYVLNVTARYDGSSIFGQNNQWGFFPSVGAAWRIIDEKFISDKLKNVISDWKLRASYGIIGNANLPYTAIYSQYTNATYPFNGASSSSGFQPTDQVANPDLKWERQHQSNLGMDMGFLNNRVSFSVDVYNKKITDLLMPLSLATSSGYATQWVNVAAAKTNGVDFSMQVIPVQQKNFEWRMTFSWAHYNSRITALFPNRDSINLALRVGQPPAGVLVNYINDGLYQTGDNFTLNPGGHPGDIKIKDLNGDGVINAYDQTIVGYNTPKGYGGFQNYFRFRDFTLSVLTAYSYGAKVFNPINDELSYFASNFGNSANVTTAGGNFWTPTNTNTNVPAPNAYAASLKTLPGGPAQGSSNAILSGNYLRIKSVTLGYTIPETMLRKLKIKSVNIYAQAIEPFLLSKYKGLDPDNGNPTQVENYPRYRSFLFGFKMGL